MIGVSTVDMAPPPPKPEGCRPRRKKPIALRAAFNGNGCSDPKCTDSGCNGVKSEPEKSPERSADSYLLQVIPPPMLDCTISECNGVKSEPDQTHKLSADPVVNNRLQDIVKQLRDDQYRFGEAAITMLTNIRESHNKRINKLTEGAEKERLGFRVQTIDAWANQVRQDSSIKIATIGFDKNCTANEGLGPRQNISQLDTVVIKSGGRIRVMPLSNSYSNQKDTNQWDQYKTLNQQPNRYELFNHRLYAVDDSSCLTAEKSLKTTLEHSPFEPTAKAPETMHAHTSDNFRKFFNQTRQQTSQKIDTKQVCSAPCCHRPITLELPPPIPGADEGEKLNLKSNFSEGSCCDHQHSDTTRVKEGSHAHSHLGCCDHSHSESRKTVQNPKQMVIESFNIFAPRAHDQDALYHIGSRYFYKTCRFIPKFVPKFSNGTVRRACIGVSLTCSVAGVICLSSLGFGVPVGVLGVVALVATFGWTGTRSGVNHDDYNVQSKIHMLHARACDVTGSPKKATVTFIHGLSELKSKSDTHNNALTRWFGENGGAGLTAGMSAVSGVSAISSGVSAISPIFLGVFGCGVRILTAINAMVRNRGQSHSIRDVLFRESYDSLKSNDIVGKVHGAINNTKALSKERKQNFQEMKDGIFRVGPYKDSSKNQNKTSYSPFNAAQGHPSVDKLAWFVLVTRLIDRNIKNEEKIHDVVTQVFKRAKPIPKFGLKRFFGYYNDELQFDGKRISANKFIDEVLKIIDESGIDNDKGKQEGKGKEKLGQFKSYESLRLAQKDALIRAIDLDLSQHPDCDYDFNTAFELLGEINDFNNDTKAEIVFDGFLLGNHSEKYLAGETILHPHHQGIVWDRIHVHKDKRSFNFKTAMTVVGKSVGYAVTGIAASVGLLMLPVVICLWTPLRIVDKIIGKRYDYTLNGLMMDYYLKGLSGLSKRMDGFAKPVNEQLSKLSDPDALIPSVHHELAMAKFLELARKCYEKSDQSILSEFKVYKKNCSDLQNRFAHELKHNHGPYASCPHERRKIPLGSKIVYDFLESKDNDSMLTCQPCR